MVCMPLVAPEGVVAGGTSVGNRAKALETGTAGEDEHNCYCGAGATAAGSGGGTAGDEAVGTGGTS